MQLVGVIRAGKSFLSHALDRLDVESAEVGGALRIEPAAANNGLGAAFLQRRVVEVRIGPRDENLQRERRRLGEIARDYGDVSALDIREQPLEPVDIHCFFEAVLDCLLDERVLGNFALAGQIFRARDLIRKHVGNQILGVDALQLRRHFPAGAKTRNGKRHRGVPPPARGEHRRRQQRLHQHRTHTFRMQVSGDFCKRETMAGAEGKHDGVFGRRSLQLEIEFATEAFAQREAPCTIDPAAERRMDHQLHAAGLVEKSLEDDGAQRRQHAERCLGSVQVVYQLGRGRPGYADFRLQPFERRCAVGLRFDFAAQPRNGVRQLVAAARRLAQPKRDAGRLAARILDPHAPGFHAQDPVRRIAELKDVALQTLDRKILVHSTDDAAFGLEHHVVIGVVRYGAPGRNRGEPRAAARSQASMHYVAVQVLTRLPATRAESLREHADNLSVLAARQVAVGIGGANEIVEFFLAPFARRDFGYDLLRKHVKRLRRNDDTVELAAPDRVEQRDALGEFVARQRKEPRLGHPH